MVIHPRIRHARGTGTGIAGAQGHLRLFGEVREYCPAADQGAGLARGQDRWGMAVR